MPIKGPGFVMLSPTNGALYGQWPACWLSRHRMPYWAGLAGGRNVR